jgi:hypothetical protein
MAGAFLLQERQLMEERAHAAVYGGVTPARASAG